MKRGDVVLIDFPFSDRQGSKLRPALVVQNDFLNQRIDDTILISITRTSRDAATSEVLIDVAMEPQSGLRQNSTVACANFLTIDQRLVHRIIGRLSEATMQAVNDCIRRTLAVE